MDNRQIVAIIEARLFTQNLREVGNERGPTPSDLWRCGMSAIALAEELA
jgi:hypothetical protein